MCDESAKGRDTHIHGSCTYENILYDRDLLRNNWGALSYYQVLRLIVGEVEFIPLS